MYKEAGTKYVKPNFNFKQNNQIGFFFFII